MPKCVVQAVRQFVVLVVVAIAISGCAGGVSKSVRKAFPPEYRTRGLVHMTVSSFQEGKTMSPGASFTVYTPKELEGDLEFKEYAELLTAMLIRSGFRQEVANKADYSVILLYDIDQGRTEISSRSYPTYGMISGGSTQYHSGSIYDYSSGYYATYSGTSNSGPVYGRTGTSTSVQSHRVFKRSVEVSVADLAASNEKREVVISSTVKVVSEGSISVLREVMPLFLSNAVLAVGHPGLQKVKIDRVPFFSATDQEADRAVMRVVSEDYPDLLIHSAQSGDYLTVKALLRKGVNPNTAGGKGNRSALEWAVYSKNLALVQHLLESGTTVDDGAIRQAKSKSQNDMLRLLQKVQLQQKAVAQQESAVLPVAVETPQ